MNSLTLSDFKCEYEDINLPCTFCEQNGGLCIKKYGRKAQQLQSTITDVFTVNIPSDHRSLSPDQDTRYIQYFERMHQRHAGIGTYISVQTRSIPFLPAHRLSLRLSSETFRPIFLALAAFMEAKTTTNITREYLNQFYPRFIQAIEEQKYIDVFYSGFTNLVFSFMSEAPIPTVINHCNGLWNTFYKLQQGFLKVDDDELFMMETLLQVVLRSLILQNDSINPQDRRTWIEPMDKMLAFLDACTLNVYKPSTSLSHLNPSGSATGIVTLAIHLHLRLDQYLFHASPAEGNSEHVDSREQKLIRITSLRTVLDAIITAIEEFDCPEVRGIRDQLYHSSNVAYFQTSVIGTRRFFHFPDIPPPENVQNFCYHRFSLVVLYYSTLLLANTLSPDRSDENTIIAYSAAISLCRLCSMRTLCNCLAIRSLLLAGLVMTKNVHRESMCMTAV
jgi:hypothetical protein